MWWQKKLTKAQKVENAIKASGKQGITNGQLYHISGRFGATIFRMRNEGYRIDTVKIGKDGLYKYYFRNRE